VLHVTGWYDSWTRQVTMNYEALSAAKRSPQRLVIGPWVHGAQGSNVAGEVEFTPDAAIDRDAFRLRWYDRWMKGDRNGVDDDRRQHLLESEPHEQRRLRPAPPRRHPRGRGSATAVRAPRRARLPHRTAGAGRRGHRHRRGQALGRVDGPRHRLHRQAHRRGP